MNDFRIESWTFERPFRFETSGSLETVVHALSDLEQHNGFFSSSRDEISILPLNDGYTFQYRIRRRNKNSTYTTAFSEGRVWEDETGTVIVEGHGQIEPFSFYGSMGLFALIMIFGTVFFRSFGIFLPLIFMGFGAFMIFSYYGDRNRVIDRIGEAVGTTMSPADRFRQPKDKRMPTKAKNTPLSVDDAVNPNSIWNEAVSEYEDDEAARGMR